MKQRITFIFFLILGFSQASHAQFWDFTEPMKLNETINSDAEEIMPVFSEDSMILYFVRTFDETNTGGTGDQDIWFSKKDDKGFYGKSQKLQALNNKFNNGVCGLSESGNKIYLLNSYEGKTPKESGIAQSELKGVKWDSPKNVKIPALEVKGDLVNFYVTRSEDMILVAFAGPQSKGEEDLYFIRKQEDGTWASPMHMGNVINTEGFEISPYLTKTKDTLFFSSNGHGGYGDADIFYSIRQDDSWTNWSTPVNLGDKINSAKFDAYLIFAGNQFYWSSNRDGEKSDIYYSSSLLPPPLALSTETILSYDPQKKHAIDLTVTGGAGRLKYLWSNGDTLQDPSNLEPGTYRVKVTDDFGQVAEVEVTIEAPVLADVNAKMKEIDDALNKDLNNNIIYYDENSSYFNVENRTVMAAIVPLLKEKPELKIFVQSYCDKNGSNTYNLWLSEKRMNRVIDYLVANGIDRSRITGNFKGEAEPLVNCKNCNERQLRLNRRTTIKFIAPK